MQIDLISSAEISMASDQKLIRSQAGSLGRFNWLSLVHIQLGIILKQKSTYIIFL